MKNIKAFLATLTLSVASFVLFGATHAYAATRTWTGGGSDTKVSTAANWGGTAPSAGDDLIFPVSVANRTVVNDMTAGTSFNTITFNGTPAGGGFNISGNAIALVAGITDSTTGGLSNTLSLPIAFTSAQTITVPAAHGLVLSGILSGSGNLLFSGGAGAYAELDGNNTFTGTVTTNMQLAPTSLTGLGAASAGTTVNAGGDISYSIISGSSPITGTIAEPLTFNDGGSDSAAAFAMNGSCGQGACTDSTLTESGAITLAADLYFNTAGTMTLTGAITGSHAINLITDADGSLIINASSNSSTTPNGSYTIGATATTTNYTANSSSTPIIVPKNNTSVVTGTYGTVDVKDGGTLEGTGTVSDLNVLTGGTVAPGMSPGCLTVNGNLSSQGTYQAQIGGTTACTEYDQLKVTGDVDVTGSTLTASLYNSFKPAKGDVYTIIDNQGSNPVTGTFTGLDEGATVTVDGYVMAISYVGGDGNDVTLTVQDVPATPDTGFTLLKNNPIMSAAVIIVAAGGVAYIANGKKFSFARIRSRR